MLLDSNFYLETNFVQGLIHKLITIDTPYSGSEFAGRLWQSNPVCKSGFAVFGHPVDGAVQDLIPGSALLTSLNSELPNGTLFPPLLAHAIVGIASQQQETANYAAADGFLVSLSRARV